MISYQPKTYHWYEKREKWQDFEQTQGKTKCIAIEDIGKHR